MKQPMRKLLLLLCLLTALLTCVSLAAAAATTCTETSYHKMPGYTEFTVAADSLPADTMVLLACYESDRMTYLTTWYTDVDAPSTDLMLPTTVEYDTIKIFPMEDISEIKMAGKAEELAVTNEAPAVDEIVIDKAYIKIANAEINGEEVAFEYYETEKAELTTQVEFAAPDKTTLYMNNIKVGTLAESDAAEIFNSLDVGTYSHVILWDRDKDGAFDEIYTTAYVYDLVYEVDEEYECIIGESEVWYDLFPYDKKDGFIYNIYKDGEKIDLTDLAEGDFLNIVIGDLSGDIYSAAFVDIYVTNTPIESEVSAIRSLEGRTIYEMNHGAYSLAPTSEISSLQIGDCGYCYLTIDGFIYDFYSFTEVIHAPHELVTFCEINDNQIDFEYYESEDGDQLTQAFFATPDKTTLYVNNIKLGTLAESAAIAEFEALSDGMYHSHVTLRDTDKDWKMDEIYLIRYEYGIVEYVDNEQEIIETDSSYYSLSADDTIDGFVYNIYKDGEKITLSDIAEGDLLNIVIGDVSGNVETAAFVDIYVTNNIIQSFVNTAGGSNGQIFYDIDGVVYELAPNAAISSLQPGDTGRFYITIDGYIYDADITSTFSNN